VFRGPGEGTTPERPEETRPGIDALPAHRPPRPTPGGSVP
jgi:hypothetical protein